MSALPYLLQLSTSLNLQAVHGLHPFQIALKESKSHGTVVGMRRNYVVAVSQLTAPKQKLLGIMIRWPKLGENSMVKAAITSMPEFKGFLGSRKVTVADDGAVILWTYALRAPKVEEVVKTVDAVLTTISGMVSSFNGKCEDCGKVEQSTLTAQNGIPGFHCESCQQQIAGDLEQKAREYDQRQPELLKALAITTLAAVGWSIAQATLLYLFSDKDGTPIKLWVVFAILTGMIVGQLFAKSVGKIEVWPQVMYLFVIALAANIAADIGFLTFYVSKYLHVNPSIDTAFSLLRNWHRLRFSWSTDLFITFAEIGGACIPIEILRKARPKFVPVFEYAGNVSLERSSNSFASV